MKTISTTTATFDFFKSVHAATLIAGVVIAMLCSLVLMRDVNRSQDETSSADVSIHAGAVIGGDVMPVKILSVFSW